MNQRGFTLIELLVAMAVGGMIMGAVTPAIYQLIWVNGRVNGEAVALVDVQTATHWLTRDLVQAQTTSLDNGAPPVDEVTLNWVDLTVWGTAEGSIPHFVTYSWVEPQLQRNYDGAVTTVGNYLTSV